MGGSSKPKKQVVGHRYFLDMFHVVANGEASKLHRVVVGGKDAATNLAITTNNSFFIDKDELFGGEEKEGGIKGTVNVYFGRPNQAAISGVGIDGVGYLGVFAIKLSNMYVGTTPYLKYWAYDLECNFETGNSSDMSIQAISFIDNLPNSKIGSRGDMNPAHLMYALTTSKDYGLGYTDYDIDQDSVRYAAQKLYDEGFGLSFQWTDEQSVEDFMTEIMRHIEGAFYLHPLTGLYTLKLMRDDYDIGDLPVFNRDNVVEVLKYDRPAIGETVNEVIVTYIDGATGKKRPVSRRDSALFAKQGYKVTSTIDLPGVATFELADKICQQKLHALGAPLASVELETNRDGSVLGIGDVFKWVDEDLGVTSMVLRVLDIGYGSADSKTVKLTCIQDIFSLSSTVYTVDSGSDWTNPSTQPAQTTTYKFEEIPYAVLLPETAALNYEWNPTSYSKVMVLAEAPSYDTLKAQLYSATVTNPEYIWSGDSEYNATMVLAKTLEHNSTTVYYVDRFYDDLLEAYDFINIAGEWIRITSIDTTAKTMVVQRGLFDTRPRRHIAGSFIYGMIQNMQLQDGFSRYLGDTVNYKICAVTGNGALSLATSNILSYIVIGRQYKPYTAAYGSFRDVYCGGITSQRDLTHYDKYSFKARNRLTQAANLIPDSSTSTYAEEASCNYTMSLTDEDTSSVLYSTAVASVIPADLTTYSLNVPQYVADLDLPRLAVNASIKRSTVVGYQDAQSPIYKSTNWVIDDYSALVYSLTPNHYYPLFDNRVNGVISRPCRDMADGAPALGYLDTGLYPHRTNTILIPKTKTGSLWFYSSKAYIPYEILSTVANPAYSLKLWFKLLGQTSGKRTYLFSTYILETSGAQVCIYVKDGFLHVIEDVETHTSLFSPVAITLGNIYQVVVTRSSHDLKLYVNGSLIGTVILSAYSTKPIAASIIGETTYDIDSDSNADLYITQVATFTSALSGANILALYNKGTEAHTKSHYDDKLSTYSPYVWFKMNEYQYLNDGILVPSSGSVSLPANVRNSGNEEFITYADNDVFSPFVSDGIGYMFVQNWATYARDGLSNMNSRIIIAHNEIKDSLSVLGSALYPFTISFFSRPVVDYTTSAVSYIPDGPFFYLANAANSGATKVTASIGLKKVGTKNVIMFASKNGANEVVIKGTRDLNDRMYHMYTVTVDPATSRVKIYIDGFLEAEGFYAGGGCEIGIGNPVYSTIMSIENNTLSDTINRGHKGQFTNFSILSQVLTSAQVRELYAHAYYGEAPKYELDSNLPVPNSTLSNSNKTVTSNGVGTKVYRVTDAATHAADFCFECTNTVHASNSGYGITYGSHRPSTRTLYLGESGNPSIGVYNTGISYNASSQVFNNPNLVMTAGNVIQIIVLPENNLILAQKSGMMPMPIYNNLQVRGPKIFPAVRVYELNAAVTIDCSASSVSIDIPRGVQSFDGVNSTELETPISRMLPDTTYLYNGIQSVFNNTTLYKNATATGTWSNGYWPQSYSRVAGGKYCFEVRFAKLAADAVRAGICTQRASGNTVGVGGTSNGVGFNPEGQLYVANTLKVDWSDLGPFEWAMFCIDFATRTISLVSATHGTVSQVLTAGELPDGSYYPGFSIKDLSAGIEINLGDRAFVNAKPVGFISWDGNIV